MFLTQVYFTLCCHEDHFSVFLTRKRLITTKPRFMKSCFLFGLVATIHIVAVYAAITEFDQFDVSEKSQLGDVVDLVCFVLQQKTITHIRLVCLYRSWISFRFPLMITHWQIPQGNILENDTTSKKLKYLKKKTKKMERTIRMRSSIVRSFFKVE